MTDLRQAAKAVVDRWDSPAWEWSQQGPTADLIAALRKALEQPEQQAEPCVGKDPRCPCQDGDACHYKDCGGGTKARPVPPAQPEQGPVAYYHPHKGFYWAKPTHISAPTVVDVPPVPLYVKWKAAQRPWQGLTDDEFLEACQLAERGNYLVAFPRIQAQLKERNHDTKIHTTT